MSPKLLEKAARGLGSLRIGQRPVPGQGRLVDGLGKLAGRISGGTAVAFPWPGVRFEVNLADRIQRQMWAGTYEPHVRACLDALIDAGDVYLDVGGHVGYHAVAAAHKVGASGGVFAFEADPMVYERLARNLRQFSWSQATQAAVWDHSGELAFVRSSEAQESGWGTLSAVRDLGDGERVNVRAISLDDWRRQAQVKRWDMMKLDAEGSELAVLRGAQNALEEFRPVIIMEINGVLLKYGGFSPEQVVEFLKARGYSLYRLSFPRLEPWNTEAHGAFSEALCLPDAHAAPMLERLKRSGFSYDAA